MTLDKQVVGVNFTGGLDTQSDKRIVVPGRLVELDNGALGETDTIIRRNGNAVLATATSLSGMVPLADQLVGLDGTTLKAYSQTAQALYGVGSVNNLTLAKQEIERGTGGQDSYDCATSGGFTCYVWRAFTAAGTITGCMITIHDEATNSVVMPATFLRTGTLLFAPKVVAVTGAFVTFYRDNAGANLYSRVVALSAPDTLGAETTLRTDAGGPLTEACASGTTAFVLYGSVDATNSVKAFAVTRSGTTPSVSAGPVAVNTQVQFAQSGIAGGAIAMYSATLIGVFVVTQTTSASPGLWAGVLTTGMAVSVASALVDATAAALTLATTTAVLNGTTMWVYSDDQSRKGEATATARLIRRIGLNSSNAVVSAAATWTNSMTRPNGTNGPFLAGRAFVVGSTAYIPLAVVEAGTGVLQNSVFLADDSFRIVARALYGTYGPPSAATQNYPAVVQLSSTTWAWPVGERTLLSFAGGLNVSTTGLARLVMDFAATTPLVRAQLGPATYLANAIGSVFDGDAAVEAAFNLFPEVVTASSPGAGNVNEGSHFVAVLYEWVDGAGQRHQSAPSPAIEIMAAVGGSTFTVVAPSLTLTQKTAVTVVAYATKTGGSVFYRINPVSSPVANSTTAPTVSITYNISDTTLGTQEILYTTGGILPNNAPPPTSALAVHQNRVFVTADDDPFAFQFSQPWVNGFGVQWNETLRGRVESTGGLIKGLASLDDKLVIFRPRRIGILFGQGPSATGALNGYQLQDLPVDVGCSEPRSILVMPEGVIFKSTSKGWYRLGRDLTLQWIGAGVQEWDSQGVTSAVLVDTLKECRFTTNDASGKTLVYFYGNRGPDGVGQWATYSNFTAVDAVWWPGGNAYVRATATKFIKELPATAAGLTYGDEATSSTGGQGGTSPAAQTGTPIVLTFRTGWLKPGEALQAFQRIWRVLLTGAAAGYPPPVTTLTANFVAGVDTYFTVADTSAFTADQLLGVGPAINYGAATYETNLNGYTITSATRLTPVVPGDYTQDHFIGERVQGQPTSAVGAAGTLAVSFYFDGDDSTPFQTVTTSDVSDLVSGNAWNVRLQPNFQKCDAIMIKVVSTPAAWDPGASLSFSGMTMELGVKKGARKYPAAQTKG